MPHLGMMELLIVLAIVLLLFGARKVPELARSMGQGMKEFKQGLREAAAEVDDTAPPSRESRASESPAAR